MTKNSELFEKSKVLAEPAEPKKKLSRKEKDEAFRLMNENFSKAMDLYFADLDRKKAKE